MFVLVSFLLYYFSQNKIDVCCIPLDDIIIINGERYNIANGSSFIMSNRNYEGQCTVADHFKFEIKEFKRLLEYFDLKDGKLIFLKMKLNFYLETLRNSKKTQRVH